MVTANIDIMITVYAIASINHNYIYVGMTQDLTHRIHRHNTGRERTTKPYLPFLIIYTEILPDRVEARKREKYWKSGVGKEKLRKIRNNLT